jgi:hypothetical protein
MGSSTTLFSLGTFTLLTAEMYPLQGCTLQWIYLRFIVLVALTLQARCVHCNATLSVESP